MLWKGRKESKIGRVVQQVLQTTPLGALELGWTFQIVLNC